MSNTKGLTPYENEKYSMEEHWLWYLAGSLDTNANIRVSIKKDSRLKIGYRIEPLLIFSRPVEVEQVFGMISEYAEDISCHIRIGEQNGYSRLEVSGVDNIERFLEPLADRMVQQRERAFFFLEEILPLFEDGSPREKDKFIEVVEVVEELRELPIQSGSSKYDVEYFKDEWGDEIS